MATPANSYLVLLSFLNVYFNNSSTSKPYASIKSSGNLLNASSNGFVKKFVVNGKGPKTFHVLKNKLIIEHFDNDIHDFRDHRWESLENFLNDGTCNLLKLLIRVLD